MSQFDARLLVFLLASQQKKPIATSCVYPGGFVEAAVQPERSQPSPHPHPEVGRKTQICFRLRMGGERGRLGTHTRCTPTLSAWVLSQPIAPSVCAAATHSVCRHGRGHVSLVGFNYGHPPRVLRSPALQEVTAARRKTKLAGQVPKTPRTDFYL